jgi:hypothetical protein
VGLQKSNQEDDMAAKKSEGAKKAYRALTHITHNDEVYAPKSESEVLELTDGEAAPLLADKAVEPVEDKPAK